MPRPVTVPLASLERRFLAFAIDRLLVWSAAGLGGLLVWLLLDPGPWVVAAVVGAVVVAAALLLALVAGATGSSPGRAATGLRMVHAGTGTPLGAGRSLLRTTILGAAGLPTFGLGIATLAWTAVEDRDRQRRGWHDHVCHSVVIDVRPLPVAAEEAVEEGPRHIVNLTALRLVPAPAPVEVPVAPSRAPSKPSGDSVPPAPAPPVPVAPQPPYPTGSPTRVRSEQTVVRTPVAASPVSSWRLLVDDGGGLLLTGTALLGRRPEPRNGEQVAHLVPMSSADMSVSKTHAQVEIAPDGSLLVTDRGSTNGTVVVRHGASQRLAPGRPLSLAHGDSIVLGDRTLRVVREG